MDFKEFDKKFKGRKTSTLVSGYSQYNAEYKRKAREELRRRGENRAVKNLPYTRKTKPKRRTGMFGMKFNFR